MKVYLKDEINISDLIDELKQISNVSLIDCKTFYLIKYKTVEDMDSEVLRINLDDRRVIFSATSKIFKDKLKDKVKINIV